MTNRFRNVVFTLNNPTDEDEATLKLYGAKYIVYGRETAPTTGTRHLQGYMEFKNPKAITTIKKTFPTMHIEARRGTAKQASDYCKKEGDYYEEGEITKQGERTDLERVATMVQEGKTLKTIAEVEPATFIKYHRGIKELKQTLQQHRSREEPPNVVWIHGKTGVGKTKFPHDHHDSIYIKDGTQWWDGYEQQEAIIIDDFDGKWPLRDLLRLLDRYEYQGQTKGGYVKINSPWIYITSTYPPEHYWGGDDLPQIERRIKHKVLLE